MTKYTWRWQGIEHGFDAPQWINDICAVTMFSIIYGLILLFGIACLVAK